MLGHFAVQMVGCLARLIFYFYNYQFYWKLKKSKPNLNHLIIIFSPTHLGVTPSSPSWANYIFWSICRSFYHWNKKSGGVMVYGPLKKKFSIDIYKIWLIIKKTIWLGGPLNTFSNLGTKWVWYGREWEWYLYSRPFRPFTPISPLFNTRIWKCNSSTS